MVISPAHSGKDYLPVTCRDEERFGLEYDLDVYNIVAVSDFNMGGARPCLALL
jgi:aminopeptidase N